MKEMEVLSAIAGAVIGGSFTLLGSWLAGMSARKQMDMQQCFQREEKLREDRVDLYTQVIDWLQKIKLAFEYLAQAGDMKSFTVIVSESTDSFQHLAPRLEIISSMKVFEMFEKMNKSLSAFFKALNEGKTHGETLANLAVEADTTLRETARKLREAMRQEIGVHN